MPIDPEILKLQGGDHPGMSLVTVPLTGSNYLSWSRSVRLALGAKLKLGFIDGKCKRPSKESTDFEQWQRVDCMVVSWLLNSISKEIAEAFLYATSAKDLWAELEDRFGESNGPLLYQIQREIASISQGEVSVAVYYTKLKKLWDELACLAPMPPCSCGSSKALAELTASNQLMQFLMGLSDAYDTVRNQILMMDPLPNVGKAYSMILRVEKQREVHSEISGGLQNVALHVNNNGKGTQRKRSFIDKKQQYCEYCDKTGHTRETCFKLHGYPDWYKSLMEQKRKNGSSSAGRAHNVNF